MPPGKKRPRGSIEKLRSGAYRARVYAGVDPLTGKDRYLRESAPTRAAAEKAMTRLQNQVDEQRHPRTDVTVGQVIEQWLEVVRHEDSTRERNEDLIRLYITPTFGSMPAGKVDAEILERFYARLLRCKDLCNGRRTPGHKCTPLAANTVRKVHFILRAALDKAVRWRYLGVNEAAVAEPPAFERSEPDPPSAVEAARLLNEAAVDPEWCLLLWLTMITGTRRGELCALRWSDINLDALQIAVARSYSQTRDSAKEKATKTRQKRVIAVDDHTVALLQAHLEHCRRRCDALGIELPNDAFVFTTTPDGSAPLQPRSVSQRYRRLAQRLKLRSTRLHALRHYSATELLAAGVDLRTVAGRLGHVDGGVTTLNTYAGWVTEADRRAAHTISNLLPRPDATKREARNPYQFLADRLREQIRNGELQPGEPLPTVAELSVVHNVSAGTANRAIAVLKTEGLVTARRGQRAIVTQPADQEQPA